MSKVCFEVISGIDEQSFSEMRSCLLEDQLPDLLTQSRTYIDSSTQKSLWLVW